MDGTPFDAPWVGEAGGGLLRNSLRLSLRCRPRPSPSTKTH